VWNEDDRLGAVGTRFEDDRDWLGGVPQRVSRFGTHQRMAEWTESGMLTATVYDTHVEQLFDSSPTNNSMLR